VGAAVVTAAVVVAAAAVTKPASLAVNC